MVLPTTKLKFNENNFVYSQISFSFLFLHVVAIRKSRSETCGMKGITEHVFNKQEESIRQEEWRIAAYIVNRFFAWVYFFTIVLTFFIVFFKAPRSKAGTLM